MTRHRPTIGRRPQIKRKRIKRKSRSDPGPRFLVGLDLGKMRDYSALVIVERIHPQAPGETIEYHLRHTKRYPLGTPYHDIVDDVSALLENPPLADCSSLIIDGTGVGSAVVEMFRDAGLAIVPVTITAGDRVHYQGRVAKVPKRNLISILQVVFQTGRLKIAETIELRDTLINELVNFKEKITQHGNLTYGAWRESIHDDLVLALAFACWYGEGRSKQLRTQLFIEDVSSNQSPRGFRPVSEGKET